MDEHNNTTQTLASLHEEMKCDTDLPLRGEANLVFGEGDPHARIVFIGEAPGKDEDEQIRPFVGRSGQLLRAMIRDVGLREDEVYITNIVKRRPPNNRDPLPEEIAAYRPYLKRQLQLINPEIIVPLGRFSMNYFLPEAKISRDQGKAFHVLGKYIFPIFHPAAALRSPSMKREFVASFAKLALLLAQLEKNV